MQVGAASMKTAPLTHLFWTARGRGCVHLSASMSTEPQTLALFAGKFATLAKLQVRMLYSADDCSKFTSP